MSPPDEHRPPHEVLEDHLLVLRTGHGANCSSIGSVIDTLFATATVGAAVFAVVASALGKEHVRVAPVPTPAPSDPTHPHDSPEEKQ